MQIEIQGLHEQALTRLMQRNDEKTAVAMARILIRDAAKEAGVWPNPNDETVSQEQQVTTPSTCEPQQTAS